MGNWWSSTPQPPKIRYDVVLPTSCRAWELLYSGDINTWDAVAARYGMDKYAYSCGLSNCDREAVCLRYVKAALKSDNQTLIIERHKASTVQVPLSTCPDIKPLLSSGFRLNEVAAAQRRDLLLLVMHQARDFISQLAFPVIQLGDDGSDSDCKKESDKHKLLRRLSSKKDRGDGKSFGKRRFSGSSVDGKTSKEERLTKSASDSKVSTEKVKPRCVGVICPPRKDMTIISCHISPDLSQTGILFYSLSPSKRVFCYTLHCFSNVSLLKENSSEKAQPSGSEADQNGASSLPEKRAPHLLQTVTLSREVQPYFAYDPRYGSSRIAVANYECRDESIVHELVVLSLERTREAEQKEATVVKRGKLSLPALFGNSRFNLLYSKDGELIILQKLTDDRFGVTSFCDIYMFDADNLTLIKYMTAALPGLFHICKVSYEPVFSLCGSFMRILNHRVSNGDEDNEEGVEYTMVNIYQLPRALNLMSQCRRVILQQLTACHSVELLPLPHRLKDYLKFGPIY